MGSFIDEYLTIAVGTSPNTIKSYKYAFRLLLEYLYSKQGIDADSICFEQLNYECITEFLDCLESERHCSVSTKNQRLSALLSFSEYAQNRDFEAAAVFRSSLLKIPVKKGKKQCRTILPCLRSPSCYRCQMKRRARVCGTKCCLVLCMPAEPGLRKYVIDGQGCFL